MPGDLKTGDLKTGDPKNNTFNTRATQRETSNRAAAASLPTDALRFQQKKSNAPLSVKQQFEVDVKQFHQKELALEKTDKKEIEKHKENKDTALAELWNANTDLRLKTAALKKIESEQIAEPTTWAAKKYLYEKDSLIKRAFHAKNPSFFQRVIKSIFKSSVEKAKYFEEKNKAIVKLNLKIIDLEKEIADNNVEIVDANKTLNPRAGIHSTECKFYSTTEFKNSKSLSQAALNDIISKTSGSKQFYTDVPRGNYYINHKAVMGNENRVNLSLGGLAVSNNIIDFIKNNTSLNGLLNIGHTEARGNLKNFEQNVVKLIQAKYSTLPQSVQKKLQEERNQAQLEELIKQNCDPAIVRLVEQGYLSTDTIQMIIDPNTTQDKLAKIKILTLNQIGTASFTRVNDTIVQLQIDNVIYNDEATSQNNKEPTIKVSTTIRIKELDGMVTAEVIAYADNVEAWQQQVAPKIANEIAPSAEQFIAPPARHIKQ